MKVSNSSSLGSASPVRAGARAPAGAFSLPPSEAAAEVAHAAPVFGPSSLNSLGALLALQAVASPLERRRRAVRRAGRILDVLDEIKLSLLGGELSARALDQLMVAVREQREGSDDPRLEAVLNEIETRAAVEIAKLEMGRAAA